LGLRPNHLDIFPLAVLPGTELALKASEYGIVSDPKPPYLVRRTPGLGDADFAEAAALAAACDLFYTRGRAVAWFAPALKPLRQKPSAFLGRFAVWLAGRDIAPSSIDIEKLQLVFLEETYRDKGLERLLPALLDIVRCHGAWGRAIADAASTTLDLSHDPDELMGPAALDLASFVRSVRVRRCRLRIKPGPRGIPRIERMSGAARDHGGIAREFGGRNDPGGR
jgi:hypothetical protein